MDIIKLERFANNMEEVQKKLRYLKGLENTRESLKVTNRFYYDNENCNRTPLSIGQPFSQPEFILLRDAVVNVMDEIINDREAELKAITINSTELEVKM